MQSAPGLERKKFSFFQNELNKNEISFAEKVLAEEERAKTSEEKFQKLKNMYTQIRDEHIKLLRQASCKLISFFDR